MNQTPRFLTPGDNIFFDLRGPICPKANLDNNPALVAAVMNDNTANTTLEAVKAHVEDDSRRDNAGGAGDKEEQFLVALRRALMTPPVAAPIVALLVGLCEPLSDALFRGKGALSSGGVAIRTLGSVSVPLSVLLMAAALVYRPPQDVSNANKAAGVSLSPRTVAALCTVRLVLVPAVGIGLCRFAMQAGFFEPTPNGGLAEWRPTSTSYYDPNGCTQRADGGRPDDHPAEPRLGAGPCKSLLGYVPP